ncbi:hypothetical protein SAMN04488510_10260 [Fervidobacterium changbaicum]|uniref:Uncharacterized protein n=2 Tax=Fervidobacterium TaxID=2422 RepID=A0AAI8GCZ9_FERIS|nr:MULTISPECIES: hypothetical protein [Fervidobacterium]AMW32741.1 hypothetical protein NA23_05265 [Fervidobacterium islandicum]QAV32777.1 hypothetical protein CBS1_02785 [Fervidobacterium changbaicum]SDG95886.1 hypothetical protein SAMN04488510_10260 [Fervidobacterium changbaicum]
MVVEVNNISLFEYYEGFSDFQEQIFQCKLNFLVQLSKMYAGSKFVFYNALGRFGVLEEVYKILGNIFEDFELDFGKEPVEFDSSPVNNLPHIRVDGKVAVVDNVETIGLVNVEDEKNLKCEYTKCFYLLENLTERDLEDKFKALKVEIMPRNFFESEITSSLRTTNQRYFVLKLIRGEEICL